ncbi:MAG TPA: hypothetical protein PK210_04975 [Bacteroidia bacterium]|nr:hypothetical protein [Bacteroidia bacterium]
MIPECIELPFIGLRNGCDDSSFSGLYINDLEGISLRLASESANGEIRKGEDLIRIKERMAIIETIRDFKLLVQNEIQLKDVIAKDSITGNWGDYETVGRVGFHIKRCADGLHRIEVQKFCVFPEDSLKAVVNINEDGQLRQIEVELEGGKENCIKLNIKSKAQEIYVYVNLCTTRCKKITECTCNCGCNCCFDMTGIHMPDVEWIEGQYYVKTDVLCRCDFESLVCTYRDELALAVLYKVGIKLLNEVVFTQNYSGLIANSKADAAELLKIWEGVPAESTSALQQIIDPRSEYSKSLMPVVMMARQYLLNHCKDCIECTGYNIVTHCLN